jgi:hypothetical protein
MINIIACVLIYMILIFRGEYITAGSIYSALFIANLNLVIGVLYCRGLLT